MIDQLKEQIFFKIGKKIVNRGDCEHLSRLIEIETGEYLNYNTLRRFFGIDKKEFKPRPSTLDILSRYIGYHSFEHYGSFNPQKARYKKNLIIYELLTDFNPEQLAEHYHKLQANLRLDYLIQICRHGILSNKIDCLSTALNLANIDENSFSYDEIVVLGNSIGILFRSVKLSRKEWKTLLENTFINIFILEIFVDYSSLNTYYFEFIKHPAKNENQGLFKYCLKYLRDYLLLKKLKPVDFSIINLNEVKPHPILVGRFFSLNIYCQEACIDTFEKIQNITAEQLYEPMVATLISSNFELVNFINQHFLKTFDPKKYRHTHYFQVYFLMNSSYLYKSDNPEGAKNTLKKVQVSEFRFSYKELLTFFYFLLDYKLYNNEQIKNSLYELKTKLNYPRLNSKFIESY